MSSFFASVFVREGDLDGPEIDFVGISKPTNSMLDFNISFDDVCKKLKQLKDDKSPRPDGIHPMVLKKMTEIGALPLKSIFNRFMLTNKLPIEWKSANISPILRKRVKVKLGNYRPVSLTAVLCTIMESVIRDKC